MKASAASGAPWAGATAWGKPSLPEASLPKTSRQVEFGAGLTTCSCTRPYRPRASPRQPVWVRCANNSGDGDHLSSISDGDAEARDVRWGAQPVRLVSINPERLPSPARAEAAVTVPAPRRESAGPAGTYLCGIWGSVTSARFNRSSASAQGTSRAAHAPGCWRHWGQAGLPAGSGGGIPVVQRRWAEARASPHLSPRAGGLTHGR